MSKTSSYLDAIEDRVIRTKFKQLDQRLSKIEGPVSTGFVSISSESNLGQGHANKHASSRASVPQSGTDPLDQYQMDWKKSHTFRADTGISVKISPPADGADDALRIVATDGVESFAHDAQGRVQLGGATAAARLSIAPRSVDNLAPDTVGVAPWCWVRAEDWKGKVAYDVNITSSDTLLIENSSNSYQFLPKNSPSKIRLTDAQINGYAILRCTTSATDTDPISISGNGAESGDVTITGVWTLFAVYSYQNVAAPDKGNRPAIMGSNLGNGNNYGVAGASQGSSTSYGVHYDGGNFQAVSETLDMSSQETMIVIIRRDASDNHYVFATNASGDGEELTLSTPLQDSGTIKFDALFALDNDSGCPAATQIAEVAVFKSDIGAAAAQNLYQYAAVRYGMNQVPSGENSLQWQSSATSIQGVVDSDGLLGLGNTDPQRRLHLESADGNPQYRQAYNSNNYVEAEVNSSGELHYTGVKSGSSIAATMPKIPRGTDPPTAADHPQEFFLHDRTQDGTAKGDELLVCMQDYAGTWTWVKVVELGPASGGFF